MAPHSSTLAWKIPQTEESGGLQSMGSWRVGHDWATSLSLFTFMHWRRKWQPTPVFLPGESQGRQSLVGCRLWGRTELETTEVTAAAALLCFPTFTLVNCPWPHSLTITITFQTVSLPLRICSTSSPACYTYIQFLKTPFPFFKGNAFYFETKYQSWT